MEKKCTTQEFISPTWERIMMGGVAVAVLFTALFIILDDTLLGGFFRLFAFAGFAAFVMAFLQKRSRIDSIDLEVDRKNLTITYFKSSEIKQEELFDLKTIKDIQTRSAPAIWKVFPRAGAVQFLITFTDSDNTLSMFRLEGRDIYLSEKEAQTVKAFLNKHVSPTEKK